MIKTGVERDKVIDMKKKTIKRIVAIFLVACMLGGCGMADLENALRKDMEDYFQEKPEGAEVETGGETPTPSYASNDIIKPLFLRADAAGEAEIATPNVAPYTVAPDLSNVENLWQFYFIDDVWKEKLVKNGFLVKDVGGSEFYETYEWNRYTLLPNFVTVDSLMHTYHLYFSHLMKNIEKGHLSNNLSALSVKMAENSAAQYEALKGSEWEEAAARNVAFFTVGARLLEANAPSYDYAEGMVSQELAAIGNASSITDCVITGEMEDYTQYVPRGYYEGDAFLEKYFRAMMWYGRIHFRQDKEELDRSALLTSLSLMQDADAYKLWESIYAVTSFFAGASDDSGVCEYMPLIKKAYGENVSVNDLIGNQGAFEQFHKMTAALDPPMINSVPIMEGESNVIKGFRFMGQRFTIDAAVMQQLIYQNVKENDSGGRRMLPDVLDMPAALGSDMALQILSEQGDVAYAGYSENMEKLKEGLSRENKTLWTASLYANWLNTLRPLLDKKGEGYPFFMQNDEWTKKNLECFAGSFTELKHDTVLYTKQVIAEMGGGMEEEPDDRGYVEPEPLVYARFQNLASLTADGLKRYGMLDAVDEENLMRLSEMAKMFYTISNKELRDEILTEDEYEFIRCYGGNLEHFWVEAVKNDSGVESVQELPAAVVVDIATDPNGQVLEAATGNPSNIYVLVKVDGKIKIAIGSVYSFYQFPWPMDDRLTDSKWRYMMGYQAGEDGSYVSYGAEKPVEQPWWTQSYRY